MLYCIAWFLGGVELSFVNLENFPIFRSAVINFTRKIAFFRYVLDDASDLGYVDSHLSWASETGHTIGAPLYNRTKNLPV